jgi:hypothetical protein
MLVDALGFQVPIVENLVKHQSKWNFPPWIYFIFLTQYMAFGNRVRLCWQVGARSLFEWPRSWIKYCNVMCEPGTWARHMGLQAHFLITSSPICIQIPPSYFLHFMFNKMVLWYASKGLWDIIANFWNIFRTCMCLQF